LRQPAGSWPQSESGDEQDLDINDAEEVSSEFALVAAYDICISFQRILSSNRLLRTTAWVLRFTTRCRRQRSQLEEYNLTAAECAAAEDLLIRQLLRSG